MYHLETSVAIPAAKNNVYLTEEQLISKLEENLSKMGYNVDVLTYSRQTTKKVLDETEMVVFDVWVNFHFLEA